MLNIIKLYCIWCRRLTKLTTRQCGLAKQKNDAFKVKQLGVILKTCFAWWGRTNFLFYRCTVYIRVWSFSKNFSVTNVKKNFPTRKIWCTTNYSNTAKIHGMIVVYVTNSLTVWNPCVIIWRKNTRTKTKHKPSFTIKIWISLLPFLPNLPYLPWETWSGRHLQNVHDLFFPSLFHSNPW